ncbi:hypothetical protein MMJ56_10050, partial [Enterococcus cecorum]|uniref:hypothetical protein n=2 Tax=Enterococcus cecorum TaxID=44008 RepID=UPI001FAE3C37
VFMKLIRQLGLLLIIFFLGLFIGDYGNHQIPIYLAPIVILWIMAWDDRRNRMLKRKMKQQKTKNQSNYFYIYDQEYPTAHHRY